VNLDSSKSYILNYNPYFSDGDTQVVVMGGQYTSKMEIYSQKENKFIEGTFVSSGIHSGSIVPYGNRDVLKSKH
jgi:hypothetical protein